MQPSETEPILPAGGPPPRANPAPVADPRVYLAAERTFLSWMRTAVALMGFGFLIARFGFLLREYAGLEGVTPRPRTHVSLSPALGFGMVVLGVVVLVTAAIRHRRYIRALNEGVANPSLGIGTAFSVATIVAIVGLAMAVQILLF